MASGGFVYFALDASVAGNPWVADWKLNADTVKSYAARLPALASAATASRQLFAARLLPIVATPPSNLTEAQFEAENTTTASPKSSIQTSRRRLTRQRSLPIRSPGTDAGIQVGWDDEQVTVWFNNQVDLLRYRLDPGW